MADFDGECIYHVEKVVKPKPWYTKPMTYLKNIFEFMLTVTVMLSGGMAISISIHGLLPDHFAAASMYSILTMIVALQFGGMIIKAAKNYRRNRMIYHAARVHTDFMANLLIWGQLTKPLSQHHIDHISEQMLNHLAETINERLGK